MLVAKAHVADATRWKPGKTVPANRFLLRALNKGVSTLLPGILIALFINVFVVQAMIVQGPSMNPNLVYNQRVIVDKIT